MITSLTKPFEPKFWELKTGVLESRKSVLVNEAVALGSSSPSEVGKTTSAMF